MQSTCASFTESLEAVFGRSNILTVVRTDFAFHYSPSELDDALVATPDQLDLFLADEANTVNSLYYFAEVLANRAILERVDPDESTAMKALIGQIGGIGKEFITFSDGYISMFLERHNSQVWEKPPELVPFEALPRFLEIELPFFVHLTSADLDKYLSRPKG